jgi:hypothetical protein
MTQPLKTDRRLLASHSDQRDGMTQKIRRRIEALENATPQSIWTAVHLTDDEIIDRALERLSDEDLKILEHLSNSAVSSSFCRVDGPC